MDVHELNIDKLKTIPLDLSKLSNVVNNDLVKKAVYDSLFIKFNAIESKEFVLKTQYNTNKSGLGKKIVDANKKILDTTILVIIFWHFLII